MEPEMDRPTPTANVATALEPLESKTMVSSYDSWPPDIVFERPEPKYDRASVKEYDPDGPNMRLATNRTKVMTRPMHRTITRRRLFLLTLDPPTALFISPILPLMYEIGGIPLDLLIQRRVMAMMMRMINTTARTTTDASMPPEDPGW